MARKRGGTDLLTLRSAGLKRLVRDATITEQATTTAMRRALERQAPSIVNAYRRFAPVESGRMRDSIYAKLYTNPGGSVQLRVAVETTTDPVTGYDYLEQSRKGREAITSTKRRMVLSLGRSKAGIPSSRFPESGYPGFRTVKGFKPTRDWVKAGERNARRQATRVQAEVGQDLGRRGVLRSFG